MDYPPCPNPDKAALMRTGAQVRQRLAQDPTVHQVPVDKAEIWAVSDFVSAAECAELMARVDRTARPSDVLDHGYGAGTWRSSYSGDV
ncbi:MAG: hypothetical protein O9272_15095, partial [Brevundimonas sp.]|nr:hypothetical protein [Brevundimonas sp.]